MSQSTSQKSRTLTHASPYEQQVTALWCRVLQREQIELNNNFFETGGGSTRIVLLHRRIEETLKVTVPIAELFHLTTVKRVVGYLQAMRGSTWAVNQAQQHDTSRSHAQRRLVHRYQYQRQGKINDLR